MKNSEKTEPRSQAVDKEHDGRLTTVLWGTPARSQRRCQITPAKAGKI